MQMQGRRLAALHSRERLEARDLSRRRGGQGRRICRLQFVKLLMDQSIYFFRHVMYAAMRVRLNCAHDPQTNFSGLAELLPKVATDDRTVIITSVNEAFARPGSLLGLFRESFHAGERIDHFLDHLIVVAVDPMAYRHCRSVHRFCYLLPPTKTSMNLSSASDFMSDAYVELVWTKLELQQRVLQLGYSFLFTDVDILWFRDPFRHIGLHADMATSCDVYSGDPDDLNSLPNTGFYYVKATNRTVEMLRCDLRIRVQFLDPAHFGGFCQLFHNDMATACTMHANCCVGMANKISDLRDVLGQWKNYTVMPPAEKKKANAAGGASWRDPAKCGRPTRGHSRQ
ncbi:hypothetical protein ZWY2020_059778 [Hordeum vulgare]|nr:hypothetical protein ZWY2020_059778 [Hordeum vulgare]